MFNKAENIRITRLRKEIIKYAYSSYCLSHRKLNNNYAQNNKKLRKLLMNWNQSRTKESSFTNKNFPSLTFDVNDARYLR